jgi:hypothetical protein
MVCCTPQPRRQQQAGECRRAAGGGKVMIIAHDREPASRAACALPPMAALVAAKLGLG